MGCVNVHGSLLPKYRGAAPVQWAVINGETKTGITTMLMDEGMDTGPMLLQGELDISLDDTAGTLAPRMAELGGQLLIKTIAQLKAGTLVPKRQDDEQATMAPLLKKEDGLIDWTMNATSLANRVRGLSPWPGAFTCLGEGRWNIWKAVSTVGMTTDKPGTIVAVNKQAILVATGEGVLEIREIQTANSKRMSVGQFLAGHRVTAGMQLGSSTA
jgi:methionyl-tRNA formyltransferase